MTLPFRTAQTATANDTHLVLSSPAVPGHRPDHLPPQALCGQAVTEPASTAVGDVHCRGCLLRTPGLPGAARLRRCGMTDPTRTDGWLAATGHMPALQGPAGTAERLLLLMHYGVDWQQGWVGRYRTTYWDSLLPDRVITATYRASPGNPALRDRGPAAAHPPSAERRTHPRQRDQ